MRTLSLTLRLLFLVASLYGQDITQPEQPYWQIGIGFGELPMQGSFKPSITFGYHFNEKLYLGLIYQFNDQIQRNGSSFNAQSSGLDGLESSVEKVSQRFMLQGRYTPFKYGPYLSAGIVYNGSDQELMVFEDQIRSLQGTDYGGTIAIQQTRKAGWGPAFGLGYQYNFNNGISVNAEWTPAWFTPIPEPEYEFSGTAPLSPQVQEWLANKMTESFQSTVTNRYKIFHIGLAYRWAHN